MKKTYVIAAGIVLALAAPLKVFAASNGFEAEGVYRGVAENGLTGIGHTVSPYTIGTGLSVSVNGFMQPTTGGTASILSPSVTLGLGDRIELSARTGLFDQPGLTGTTDTEVYAKYKIRDMGEAMPAMAVAAGVILPTASDPLIRDVTTTSGRFMFIAGGEAQVTEDAVIGLYFNIAHNIIDPGAGSQYEYTTSNLAVMAPISDDKKLQAFAEANWVSGKTTVTPLSFGTNAKYRVGMRYAGRFLKITAGIEAGWTTTAIAGGVTFEI